MNLNSYIGLMGGRYASARRSRGTRAAARAPATAVDLDVPDPDYVLTLDADSVLLPEYCLRLVLPARAAGVRARRGRPDAVQRVPRRGDPHRADRRRHHRPPAHRPPGHDALRRDLLGRRQRGAAQARARRHRRDRARRRLPDPPLHPGPHGHRGHRVERRPRLKGWTLHNYPERLSYSATPPDFGSLCIQRQRWANGGLLILAEAPPLRRGARDARRCGAARRAVPALNYMASIAWASVGLIVLLAYPFNGELLSPIVLADRAAVLRRDVERPEALRLQAHWTCFRIYGFNLILLAVNLSGVAEVARAGDRRAEDRVRADAEGAQPDDRGVSFVARPLRDHRVRAVHALARRPPAAYAHAALRGGQRGALRLRRRRVHRHPPLARRSLVEPRPARLAAGGAGSARAGGAELDWVTVLYDGARTRARGRQACVAERDGAAARRTPSRSAVVGAGSGVRDGATSTTASQAPAEALARASSRSILAVTAGIVRRPAVKATERAMDVTPAVGRGAVVRAVRRRDADAASIRSRASRTTPSNDVVLGFVVASKSGECTPTWGTYYDLAGRAPRSTSTGASPGCGSAAAT